ncbi:hypothetical protein QL285_061906 [Trifolium repens]|nr:hypothetical protein QL285_061906 [Trifolium repens]
MAIRGRGTGRGRGRGRNPPQHSPGVKNDRNERQTKGLTGADARKGTRYGGCQSTHATLDGRVDAFGTMGVNNDQSKRESQGFTEADEYYADNDSEDEGMRVIRKRKNQQRSLRQEKTSMPTTSMPSSGGSHDRRKVISVEAVSNPRRFVPQTVTRDIISRVITRMPTPAEKWKDYPIETKDELFKDFIVIWIC